MGIAGRGSVGGLLLVAVLATGCATGSAVPPGVLDVTGVWQGTWNGGAIGVGRVDLTLEQRETRVTGKLSITGVQAISATDGPVEGRVSGSTFSFAQPDGVVQGEMMVTGDEMTGYATGKLQLFLTLRRQAQN